MANRERDRVLADLSALIPDAHIREVGSTAIEGVVGKEDIDILVLVSRDQFAKTRETLDRHFARDQKQLSSEIYQGYHASTEWDVSVQLTVRGSQHDTFEQFAQLLRADAHLRDQYNTLKRAWDGRPMIDYRKAKAQFIESALGST